MYCVPASAYSLLLLIWGERVNAGTNDCVQFVAPLIICGNRGECALDEAEVRREAWYERACEWKAAEGEEGADMAGELVSMVGWEGSVMYAARVHELVCRYHSQERVCELQLDGATGAATNALGKQVRAAFL